MTDMQSGEAMAFATKVLQAPDVALPPAVVLDIGVIESKGWAVVEADPAWASGIYGCDPARVISVIARACVPSDRMTDVDRPWIIERV
jgi:hypothetical protein